MDKKQSDKTKIFIGIIPAILCIIILHTLIYPLFPTITTVIYILLILSLVKRVFLKKKAQQDEYVRYEREGPKNLKDVKLPQAFQRQKSAPPKKGYATNQYSTLIPPMSRPKPQAGAQQPRKTATVQAKPTVQQHDHIQSMELSAANQAQQWKSLLDAGMMDKAEYNRRMAQLQSGRSR